MSDMYPDNPPAQIEQTYHDNNTDQPSGIFSTIGSVVSFVTRNQNYFIGAFNLLFTFLSVAETLEMYKQHIESDFKHCPGLPEKQRKCMKRSLITGLSHHDEDDEGHPFTTEVDGVTVSNDWVITPTAADDWEDGFTLNVRAINKYLKADGTDDYEISFRGGIVPESGWLFKTVYGTNSYAPNSGRRIRVMSNNTGIDFLGAADSLVVGYNSTHSDFTRVGSSATPRITAQYCTGFWPITEPWPDMNTGNKWENFDTDITTSFILPIKLRIPRGGVCLMNVPRGHVTHNGVITSEAPYFIGNNMFFPDSNNQPGGMTVVCKTQVSHDHTFPKIFWNWENMGHNDFMGNTNDDYGTLVQLRCGFFQGVTEQSATLLTNPSALGRELKHRSLVKEDLYPLTQTLDGERLLNELERQGKISIKDGKIYIPSNEVEDIKMVDEVSEID